MARPDGLMMEDEMAMGGAPMEGGDDIGGDMGGELEGLVGEVISAAMPGIEAAIRDALMGIFGGGGEAPEGEAL